MSWLFQLLCGFSIIINDLPVYFKISILINCIWGILNWHKFCWILSVFDSVCLFHCILNYGIVYITFCSQWGPGGQGREKTVVTPGKIEDMQRGPARIWKRKKTWIDPRILFLTFTIHMCVCTFLGEGRQAQLSVLGFISVCLHEMRWQLAMIKCHAVYEDGWHVDAAG